MEREPKAERKGRSAAEVCTSEARKIGEAPCAARSGQSPLARLGSRIRAHQRTGTMRVGVAGGNGPLKRVAEDASAAGDREETSSLSA